MSSTKLHTARKMMTRDERKRVVKTKKVTINNEGERCISTVTSRVGVSPFDSKAWNERKQARVAKVQRKIAKEQARIAAKKEELK